VRDVLEVVVFMCRCGVTLNEVAVATLLAVDGASPSEPQNVSGVRFSDGFLKNRSEGSGEE